MQFKIQSNHLRGLRRRKWNFSSAHDELPKISGQSPCSELINCPLSLWKLKSCPWPTVLHSLLPPTHANSRPTQLSWVQPHSFLYKCCSSKERDLSPEQQKRQLLSLMSTGEDFLLPHSNLVSMRQGGQATKGKFWPWNCWGTLGRASLAKLLSPVRRLLSSSLQFICKRN